MDISEEEKIKAYEFLKELDNEGYRYTANGREKYIVENVFRVIDKKDMIINEMTEYINKLDIDDDICTKNTVNPEYCNEDYTNCKKCIIEYFTKKVEGK